MYSRLRQKRYSRQGFPLPAGIRTEKGLTDENRRIAMRGPAVFFILLVRSRKHRAPCGRLEAHITWENIQREAVPIVKKTDAQGALRRLFTPSLPLKGHILTQFQLKGFGVDIAQAKGDIDPIGPSITSKYHARFRIGLPNAYVTGAIVHDLHASKVLFMEAGSRSGPDSHRTISKIAIRGVIYNV
jgi:hypothetical protein